MGDPKVAHVRSARILIAALAGLALSSGPAEGAGWRDLGTRARPSTPFPSEAIAARPDGSIVVAWFEGSKVMAAVRSGSGLSDPETIASVDGTAPIMSSLQLAADAAGNVTVVWFQMEMGPPLPPLFLPTFISALRVATMPAGSTAFGDPATATPSAVSDVVLSVDPDGPAFLTWTEAGALKVATRATAADSFDAGATVASGINSSTQMVAEGDGGVRIAWTNNAGGSPSTVSLKTARIAPGGAVTHPQTLESESVTSGNSTTFSGDLAVGDSGEIGFAYVRARMVSNDITTQLRTAFAPGATAEFSSPADLGPPSTHLNASGGRILSAPRLDVDHAGAASLSAAYSEDAGGFPGPTTATGLLLAVRPGGGSFGAVEDRGLANATVGLGALAKQGTQGSLLVQSIGGELQTSVRSGSSFGSLSHLALGSKAAVDIDLLPSGSDVLGVWDQDADTPYWQLAVYDATPPSLSTTVPATGVAATSVAMTATTTDARGSSEVTWDFGDGSTATGSSVAHAFAQAGTYAVKATGTDDVGNATSETRQITIATAGGGVSPPDTTKPAISSLSLAPVTFRVATGATAVTAAKKRAPKGTKVAVAVSEPSLVVMKLARLVRGAPRGGKCKAGAKPRKGQRRCTARVSAGELSRAVAGSLTFAFTGRLGTKALKPGRYLMRATATDAAGNASAAKSAAFRIVA